jgi:murein L,D-transpeptidase YcbB/YkuD
MSEARSGDRAALSRAERVLSGAYAQFAHDVRRPPDAPSIFYVDAGLKPIGVRKRQALEALGSAPSLAEALAAADRLNPIYDGLRRGLAVELKRGIPPGQLELVRANLDRARLLPTNSLGRYIVVDAASAQLWMVQDGRVAGTMRVIVGKPTQPTPMMAGLIRFAVLNPYWHIPPDLVPTRVAARVLSEGPSALSRERFEVVSQWGPEGRRIDAAEVNWPAVAAGRERLRVRQLPGGRNMMGAVKFMMPNKLGIYLHDTPDKSLFSRSDRRLSSGCVRVENAARLARWLFAGSAPAASGAPEERVYLPEPVPVYITYLTSVPASGGGLALKPGSGAS